MEKNNEKNIENVENLSEEFDEINAETVKKCDRFFMNASNVGMTDDFILNNTVEDILKKSIKNSMGAATAQGAYESQISKNNTALKEQSNEKKKLAQEYILNEILNFNEEYCVWHKKICLHLIEIFGNIKNKNGENIWSYGNSQKVLNLTTKYLYEIKMRLNELEIEHNISRTCLPFFDMKSTINIPVDRFIIMGVLEWNLNNSNKLITLPLKSNYQGELKNAKLNNVVPWSKWNEKQYDDFARSFRSAISNPTEWESVTWVKFKLATKKK